MRPTAYVASIPFSGLRLPLTITLTSKLLVIRFIGVMILRMWLLILAFATISSTLVMTTSRLPFSVPIMLVMPKIRQSFYLCDGFINSPTPILSWPNFAAHP